MKLFLMFLFRIGYFVELLLYIIINFILFFYLKINREREKKNKLV